MHKHERPRPEARGAVDDPRQDHPTTRPAGATVQPEAADLPDGVVTLAAVMRELADILPGLRMALEHDARIRQAPLAEPPLAYRKQQAARLCGISPRLLERLLSAGKFPRPDAYAGRCPLWTRATLSKWIGDGGGQI